MANPQLHAEMLNRWNDFFHRAPFVDRANETFDALALQYESPKRAYHNFHHIRACLVEFEGIRTMCEAPIIVETALWFHDVIYDPTKHDNEAQSARFASVHLCAMGAPDDMGAQVETRILDTQHKTPPQTNDGKILVDIDLAILGQSHQEFDAYERDIRKEYAFVPERDFRAGRAKILQSFLARPHIYFTPHFQQKYEALARENLARSIASLQKNA